MRNGRVHFYYVLRRAGDGSWRGHWATRRRGRDVRHTPKQPIPAHLPGQPGD